MSSYNSPHPMPEVKQTFWGKDNLEYVTQVFLKIWLKGKCQLPIY